MEQEEYDRRKAEDTKFFFLCHSKSNGGMYELLRDRELDNVVIANKQELRLFDQ